MKKIKKKNTVACHSFVILSFNVVHLPYYIHIKYDQKPSQIESETHYGLLSIKCIN